MSNVMPDLPAPRIEFQGREFVTARDYDALWAEVERLRDALRWYANPAHFPHEDYCARARAALSQTASTSSLAPLSTRLRLPGAT